MTNLIKNDFFYCKTDIVYPPFKNGRYIEEYFLENFIRNKPILKRKYIPALWTNFQNYPLFMIKKYEMQKALNEWVKENPSIHGYFVVVQYADGPKLILPPNTYIYSGSNGNAPLPLIYEDVSNKLLKISRKSFKEKSILCSFVGNRTCNNLMPDVRKIMFQMFNNNKNFKMIDSGGWTNKINYNLQEIFIDITKNSKFCLAPRGYGRSSFRFYEAFLLGVIPIYIWNDVNWLPFQDVIDYNKISIVIHISEINSLENILLNINEEKYNEMVNNYQEYKHLFELEGMTNQILSEIDNK
jgi:hypothetical protein